MTDPDLELYEVHNLYRGHRWLIVARDREQAAFRAAVLHCGRLTWEVADHVHAAVCVTVNDRRVHWVVGTRHEAPLDFTECPRNFLRIRHLETLEGPWAGPPLTEWGDGEVSDEEAVARTLMGGGWEDADPYAADPDRPGAGLNSII